MGKQRVPRTHAGGTWTKAKYFGFIRGALRKAAMRYPVKFQVKNAVRRVKPKGKTGKHRFEYKCATCAAYFPEKDTVVDHITPAGSLNDFADLPEFTERLFCEPDGLQVQCKPCHHEKTQIDNANTRAKRTQK